MRHFPFGHNDMLAQFRIVFAKLHFACGIFRLCIFCCRIKIASFFIFQLYDFFIAFLRRHFFTFYLFCVGFYCKIYWKSSLFYHNIPKYGRMAAMDDSEVPPGRRAKSCTYCGYGETGRRAGFRFQWGNPSEFKSLYPHQIP